MTKDETYNGYRNRETWAFNLHWQNDQGLYNGTLERGQEWWDDDHPDWWDDDVKTHRLGEYIVTYWQYFIRDYKENFGSELPEGLAMLRDEVGSWWRIDYAEVGAAVREGLEIES